MNVFNTTTKTSALALLVLALTACGGGGGSGSAGDSSNGSNNSSNGGSSGGGGTATLSGLDGDANNQDLLYFSHWYEVGEDPGTGQMLYHSVLYALDPANPEVATALPMDTQDSAQGSDMGRTHYAPLYEADIDDTDGSVSNYRTSGVVFLHNRLNGSETSEGFGFVGTEVGAADPVRVTTETYLGAAVRGATTLVRQNYADSSHAAVVYGLPGNEKRARLSFTGSDEPQLSMLATIQHIVALREKDSPDRQRYLVLATDDDISCSGGFDILQATSSASPGVGPGQSMTTTSFLPSRTEARNAIPLGGPLNDGSQYLAIHTLIDPNISGRPCVDMGTTLWRFIPGSLTPLVQVLDENGDPLLFSEGVAGGPIMPESRHLTRDGDVLYFGMASFGTQDLYRVEGNTWSVLSEQEESLGVQTGFIIAGEGRVAASVGNDLVSWDSQGGDRTVLDTSDAGFAGIQSDVLGSRDGWIFYNRSGATGRDNAVAKKIDGSDSLVIDNSRWIGASLSGEGESISNMTELSEVFLVNPDQEIAAVSAANPNAGKVVLGILDGAPDAAAMYGLAPGPHRLIQTIQGSDASEVYYVNTREAGSLRKVLDEPSGHQRPVDGF